jgi:osmotically-inducible protein OsmY
VPCVLAPGTRHVDDMTQKPKRTDADLKSDIVDELRWTPNLDSASIGVAVSHGAVTLSGEVDSYPELVIAEQAALRVSGVTALAEEITVRHAWGVVNDTDIAREASEAIDRAVDVPANRVKATVHDHVITLSGSTPWNFQRVAATRAVRYLKGVTGVQNKVTLRPTVSADGIKSAISEAFARDAQLEARKISVTSENGEVTLEGDVHS